MSTLFDLLNERTKSQSDLSVSNLWPTLENKNEITDSRVQEVDLDVPEGLRKYFSTKKEYLAHLEHLEHVKATLYNEEDIRKSGLSRSDYIRLHSYVGSRMNTDFRGSSKYASNKENENKAKELSECVNENVFEEVSMSYEIKEMFGGNGDSQRLLIIDGSSLLTTSFFANLPFSYKMAKTDEDKKLHEKDVMNVNGVYVNGVYTSIMIIMNDLLKNTNATHIAVTLDLTRNSFRKTEIYPEYKATRKETNPLLKSQYPIFKEFLENIGIKVFESEFGDEKIYEADDFTASIAEKFINDIPVAIYTKDEDHLQLLKDGLVVWSKMDADKLRELKQECLDAGFKCNEDGIPNSCFEFTVDNLPAARNMTADIAIDVKALGGDSSDNIPGVRGVSLVTAKELMKKYRNIETLYSELDALGSDKKALKAFGDMLKSEVISTTKTPVNALIKYRDSAFLSKKLGVIKCDVEIDCTLDDLKINIDKAALYKELKKYEMNSIIKMLGLE